MRYLHLHTLPKVDPLLSPDFEIGSFAMESIYRSRRFGLSKTEDFSRDLFIEVHRVDTCQNRLQRFLPPPPSFLDYADESVEDYITYVTSGRIPIYNRNPASWNVPRDAWNRHLLSDLAAIRPLVRSRSF